MHGFCTIVASKVVARTAKTRAAKTASTKIDVEKYNYLRANLV